MVKAIARSSAPIQYIPYDEAYEEGFEDMQRRVPEISKINALIGFAPTINTQEIVRSVAKYYRSESLAARPLRLKKNLVSEAVL